MSGYQDFIFVFIDIKIQYIRYLTPFKQTEIIPEVEWLEKNLSQFCPQA